MAKQENDSFPDEVVREIKFYVYRLIDPRNGETFYVGKGKGNRVFAHVREEKNLEGDDVSNKIKRIRDIRLAGFEVAHVIHRHGMDDKTARQVEAALIDAYPGLTSDVGADSYGAMHAKEIINRYRAEPAEFQHRAILICVNWTLEVKTLYDATRYAWRLKKSKAEKAEVILAVRHGLIVGAFVAKPREWLDATTKNFPLAEDLPGKFGFNGDEAPDDIQKLYVGRRVPDEYRKPGAANPIKYTW